MYYVYKIIKLLGLFFDKLCFTIKELKNIIFIIQIRNVTLLTNNI